MRTILFVLAIFSSQNIYSQVELNLIVDASNIRIWKTPLYVENYRGEKLNLNDKITFVNKQIQDLGKTKKIFYSFYQKENPKNIYYVLSSEINVQVTKAKIIQVSDAILIEKKLKSIFLPCSSTSLMEGDILSISNTGYYNRYQSVLTNINKAAFSISDALDSKVRGLYRIKNLFEFETLNDTKTILQCESVNTPFNFSSNSSIIYIDYTKAVAAQEIQLHLLGGQNDFNYSLISAAYQKDKPQLFYEDYLSLILGKELYANMNEFQIHKLKDNSINFMDSIYNLKNQVLELSNKNVFSLGISEYDFTNKCYYIKEFSEDLGQTLANNSLTKLCESSNSSTSQRGFINLILFDSLLRIEPERAELFLKQTRGRKIVAVAYFHWLSETQAKDFSKRYNIEPDNYNYQKVIDSLLIYPNSNFERKWFTLYPNQNARIRTKAVVTIPASFPGGEAKFRQYVGKNFKKSSSDVIRVDYKLKVKIDGSLEFIEITANNAEAIDSIKNMILRGPKWVPAILDGRQSESVVEGYWLF